MKVDQHLVAVSHSIFYRPYNPLGCTPGATFQIDAGKHYCNCGLEHRQIFIYYVVCSLWQYP